MDEKTIAKVLEEIDERTIELINSPLTPENLTELDTLRKKRKEIYKAMFTAMVNASQGLTYKRRDMTNENTN